MVRMVVRDPAGSTLARDVFQRIVNEVFQLQGAILRYGDRVGAEQGVSSSRWQVIAVLAHAPLPVAAVARRLSLTRQSVQSTTDLLVAEGLVAMVENPDHQRARLAQLTAAGKRAHAALARRQADFCLECTRGLAAADLIAFEQLMTRLRERIEQAGTAARRPRRRVRRTSNRIGTQSRQT